MSKESVTSCPSSLSRNFYGKFTIYVSKTSKGMPSNCSSNSLRMASETRKIAFHPYYNMISVWYILTTMNKSQRRIKGEQLSRFYWSYKVLVKIVIK